MCKSVRGAAFFGSSIHLGISFVFLCWFVFDTLISEININLWKCEPPELKFRDIDPLAHYLNVVFKLLYFISLFVTGIYIFRGVERERPRTLKFAALGFVILQIVGVVLFSVFFTIQWNTEPEPYIIVGHAPEAAQLSAAEGTSSVVVEPPPNVSDKMLPCEAAAKMAEVGNEDKDDIVSSTNLLSASITEVVAEDNDNVTPLVSENVLSAPDINETTTTTPIPAVVVGVGGGSGDATTTRPGMTTGGQLPCSGGDCGVAVAPKLPHARRRLPHNQLVSLVLQMCFAIANGVGSVMYVIVLALYMLKM